MSEIVKVQVPLASSRPDGMLEVLVYAKGRRNFRLVYPPEGLLEKIGGDLKAYFHATWTGKEWVINDRAPDQEW